MKSMKIIAVLLFCLASPAAFALQLAEITYPVHLPYNQVRMKIEVRPLPYATRACHPEFIGAALSAPYVVPYYDSSGLPKDINVINVCRVRISTTAAKDGPASKLFRVALKVDLSNFVKPESHGYEVFSNAEIISSIAQALTATLEKHKCAVSELEIVASEKHPELKKLLEELLRSQKGEQADAGQPATRPGSKSNGSDKPQPESEGRSR